VVVASDKAMFGLPEIRIGLWPFFIYRAVEAAIGNRRTLQASLTGHLFHPDDAMRWGLVHRICPAVELNDRVKVMARELGKASPVAIAAGLEYVQKTHGLKRAEAGKIAAELRGRVMGLYMLVFIGGTPIMWAGPVSNWLAACEQIERLDVDTIVPGHGPVTDKEGPRQVRRFPLRTGDAARQERNFWGQRQAPRKPLIAPNRPLQRPECDGNPSITI